MKSNYDFIQYSNHFKINGKGCCFSELTSNCTIKTSRNSLVVLWLGLQAFNAVILDLIPGQGTKIPQAKQYNQKKLF